MENYPHELAQDAVCQSHTGHMTGLWFLPTQPLRLNTNEWMNDEFTYLFSFLSHSTTYVMYNRLISFFHKNGVFSEAQNGFRKGKCIETAVQSFIERIQKALDKRIQTIGIFIDLSKAYDVLNHELLLEKLLSYGARGTTNLWFRSYLTNRTQSIEINHSDPRYVCVNRYRSCLMEIKQLSQKKVQN